MSDEYARLLRGLEARLPSIDVVERRIAALEEAVLAARTRGFRHEQELRSLENPRAAAVGYLAEVGLPASGPWMAPAARLAETRRSALADLRELESELVDGLGDLRAIDVELLRSTRQLRTLLDERLLWLPSARPLGAEWVRQLRAGARWLADPGGWTEAGRALARALDARPLALLALLVVAVATLGIRRRLAGSLQALARRVGSREDAFRVTVAALVLTALVALPGALLVGMAGWGLQVGAEPGDFAGPLGAGLLDTAAVLFMLGLFQATCRPNGLLVGHFRWDAERTRRLGRALRLLAAALAPAALVTGMAQASGTTDLVAGLGRLGFLVGSLALTLFVVRVLRPSGGALTDGLHRAGLAWRTRRAWFAIVVSTPAALAALAASGYYATASELQSRFFTSGWIVLATMVAYHVAMRGVAVASAHAAYRQAETRRARAAEESKAREAANASGEAVAAWNEAPEIDPVAVSQQTRVLLRAASGTLLTILLWGLWSGLVPALGVFDDVVLWSHVTSTAAGEAVTAVTLGHVLSSLLVLVLTAVAARNLPGFLEIAVLQRLAIDEGTRYAVGTIVRYGIVAIGLVTAFNGIGADWSELQWVVAALGVGLGFGLQEIVANFISGIIILFERPVRVGDLVRIGATLGTVTRIKIRAITITDPDNFEVLVPNKAFITEAVQNWSLTSSVTRLVIRVGIAYGSDVARAQQIMLDAAAAQPDVLGSPTPTVLFLGFGDSALELELRVFVGKIEHRLPTTDALHAVLDAAFRDAGIEIPFPQRDLHVRSLPQGRELKDELPTADRPPWAPRAAPA